MADLLELLPQQLDLRVLLGQHWRFRSARQPPAPRCTRCTHLRTRICIRIRIRIRIRVCICICICICARLCGRGL